MLGLWLIVAPIALLAGAVWFARWRGARAEAALDTSWRRALGGQTFLERYPATEDNETTLALEALGCGLGIEMAPDEGSGRCRPNPEAARCFQAIEPALKKLFDPTAVAEDGSLAAPPDGLATYLETARPTLDRATALLLSAPPPAWKLDLGQGLDLKIPNDLGILNLERLIAAEARERARAGRVDAAFETLEAAWIYDQALLEMPNELAQRGGQAALKAQLVVLRALPRAPAVWRARLTGLDLRGKLLVALQADAFAFHRSSTFDRPPYDTPNLPGWRLVRLGFRDHARRYQAMIEELPRRDIRSFDPDEFGDEMRSRLPRWQFVSKIALANEWDGWPRSAHLELAAELTALGLLERERLATGAPPRTYTKRSSRVEGLHWVYETLPEGTRIRIDGRFRYPGPRPLPLIFLIRNPS
jgi:hypothetical protein